MSDSKEAVLAKLCTRLLAGCEVGLSWIEGNAESDTYKVPDGDYLRELIAESRKILMKGEPLPAHYGERR